MMPGHNGGANWGSSAVDPRNGQALRRFEGAADLRQAARARSPPAPGGARRPGRAAADQAAAAIGRLRYRRRTRAQEFVPYIAPVDFMIQPSTGLSAIGPPWSQITAYDLNKGTILWQIPDGDVASLARTDHGHRQSRAARRRRRDGRRASCSSARRRTASSAPTTPTPARCSGAYDLPAATRRRAGRLLGRRPAVRRDRGRRQRALQPGPEAARARPRAVHGVRAQRHAEVTTSGRSAPTSGADPIGGSPQPTTDLRASRADAYALSHVGDGAS